MKQVAALLVLVAFALTARAADLADLKKLMPKDQLALAEKAEEVAELANQVANETNGLKRKELQDKAAKQYKDLAAEVAAKVRKDGLDGWVFRCTFVGEAGLSLSVPGLFGLGLAYDGMAAADKETCRDLEAGAVVAVALKPNPKARAPISQPGVVLFQFGQVNGRAVKSIAKK